MANSWLRLWHDMPTDPKWRTISRVSGQRIGDVIAVFTHMLVCASNATERGRTQSFNCEDVASALDLDTEQVAAIIDAMQSRVLDGDRLKGWEIRQVAREDGSAERAKAWREAKKALTSVITNATERKQTPDKDTDTDTEINTVAKATLSPDKLPPCPHDQLIDLFCQHLPALPQPKKELWEGKNAEAMRQRWKWVLTAKKRNGERYATTKSEAIEWFIRYFSHIEKSDFLTGKNGKFSACDLGWLLKADNFAKVLQGNYDNRAVA